MRAFCWVLIGLSLSFASCALPGNSQEPDNEIYNRYCATCHGLDARGGNASTLFDDRWQFGDTDERIKANILDGIEENGMPGFRGVLTEAQAEELVATIRRMRGQPVMTTLSQPALETTLDYELAVAHWIPADAGLKIPWAIDFLDPHTALVTERPGRLRMVINGVLHPDPISGTPRVLATGQGGLLDVAVDPDYAANGWVYLGYSHGIGAGGSGPSMTRIVRGRIRNHTWTDEMVLFEAPYKTYLPTRHHFGTRIVFDRQGVLYFSIGDRGRPEQAQDLSRPNGKVHRIHRDGTIPRDNPFANRPTAMPSIFSYGHRNPQGLALYPATGELWALEHGPRGGDELNICRAGKNYGWPVITYGINYDGTVISEVRRRDGMEQPIYYWKPSTAVCGLNVVDGRMFPYWQGRLLVANLKVRDVRLLDIDAGRVMHEETVLKDFGRVREAVCGPDGAVYLVVNEPNAVLRVSVNPN
jgi:glucose/arabinose dehydrogenase